VNKFISIGIRINFQDLKSPVLEAESLFFWENYSVNADILRLRLVNMTLRTSSLEWTGRP